MSLSFCISQPDLAANETQLLRKIQLLCLMEVRSTQGSLSVYLTGLRSSQACELACLS